MRTYKAFSIPHPFPYQGSKRGIAKDILPYFPTNVQCLIEPFCGASAISIAAIAYGLANSLILNDLNKPLMDLWVEILERPNQLVDKYEKLWFEQQQNEKEYFVQIREAFNKTYQPHHLLYLLARIVKGSVRYSSEGLLNQSPDNRRLGMKPNTMRKNIVSVSQLLPGRTDISSSDFREVATKAGSQDLVYMDPPYQGTSFTRDHRYFNGLTYDDFVDALSTMNDKGISFIISYDGTTGKKTYGKPLPASLSLRHLYIHAGRSSQATLLGSSDETIESLYLSSALVDRLKTERPEVAYLTTEKQRELTFV